MAYDRFLIAPYKNGLRKDLTSWLAPEDSFQRFDNVNVFRGKIKKRFGGKLVGGTKETSRVRYAINTTSGAGTIAGQLDIGSVINHLGMVFQIEDQIFTVTEAGIAKNMLISSGGGTATYDTTTGDYVFTGVDGHTKPVYWYPAQPIMGITHYELGPVNEHTTYVMDNRFIYKFDGTHWSKDASFTDIFHGSNKQFFWYANYVGAAAGDIALFTTNFNATASGAPGANDDPMYFYNGTLWADFSAYTKFNSDQDIVQTARIIIAWKNRLLLLNVIEKDISGPTNTAYVNRVRYSHNGSPLSGSAWLERRSGYLDSSVSVALPGGAGVGITDGVGAAAGTVTGYSFELGQQFSIDAETFTVTALGTPANLTASGGGAGTFNTTTGAYTFAGATINTQIYFYPNYYRGDGGGYIDLPIEQEIVSASIIKDRLIVYCERSTWELAYTGNAGLPFIWRNLDTNIGSEAPYSTVSFDNEAVTIATTGIYSCNGVDVKRIDNQIPEEVFQFLKTSDGTSRVHGVRDYYNGLAYWTVLEYGAQTTHTYPNKLLVFNYENSSWSFYDDTITTFGYFEQSTDQTWADPGIWKTSDSWGSYYQQGNSRFILAGNHQGFLFMVNNDYSQNAPVMTVAAIDYLLGVPTLTLPDHNLTDGEFVKFVDDNVTGVAGEIYKVTYATEDIFVLDGLAGVYKGDGTIQKVSKISMQSNDWNPYIKEGENVFLAKMDFCVGKTQDCDMTITYDLDSLGWDFVNEGIVSNANLGTNILELHAYDATSIDRFKKRLWRTIYFQASGSSVNITISLSDTQMLDPNNSLSPFELQGMILYTMKEGN